MLYSGKASSLGLKQGGFVGGNGGNSRNARWAELIVAKAPKISQIATGHDGLVAEDGLVYYTGTARRGEDGDQSRYIIIC